MSRLASPPRATIPIALGLALSAVVSCVPSRNLDDYHSNAGEAGFEDTTTSLSPSPSNAGAAGATGAMGGRPGSATPPTTSQGGSAGTSGAVQTGGEANTPDDDLPLSASDAGSTPGVDPEPDPDPAGAACADGERLGPSGHCYFLTATPASWAAARSSCQQRGADWDLVSVRSAADAAFVDSVIRVEIWIGASDQAREGTWVWAVDDQTFWIGTGATGRAVDGAYENWNSDEPNGGLGTNCARALPRSFGSVTPNAPWADLDCTALRIALCEAYPAP